MTTATIQSIVVPAMSREHAKLVASGLAQIPITSIQSVNTKKQPRAAKTCQTDDFPVKGTRKWVTEYQIYSYGQKIPVGRNKFMYTNLELLEEGYEQKTDAVKRARELAVEKQLPMTVKIVKVLEKDDNTVSDLMPKSTFGEFTVTYSI